METMAAKYNQQDPPRKTSKIFLGAQFGLRLMTIATTIASAYLTITNKQTFYLGDLSFDARYSYDPNFKFFVAANIVACAFSFLSFLPVFLLGRPGSNPANYFYLFLHDLAITGVLYGGCVAASVIGLLAQKGNSHTGWMPICDNFDKFCSRGKTSVILSYIALIQLVILTLLSANKSRQIQAQK